MATASLRERPAYAALTEHYEKLEGVPLTFAGKVNRLAIMVRGNLAAAMQGLTTAVTNLTQLLADQSTQTPLEPLEVVETPVIPEPEPTAEPAPVQAASVKTRRTVLF